jgi:hypothetical protein
MATDSDAYAKAVSAVEAASAAAAAAATASAPCLDSSKESSHVPGQRWSLVGFGGVGAVFSGAADGSASVR